MTTSLRIAMGDARNSRHSRGGIRFLIPVLFVCMLVVSFMSGRAGRESGSTAVQAAEPGRAMLQALVIPQLSAMCLSAISDAFRVCSSPGPGGIVSCTVSLIRILESCP